MGYKATFKFGLLGPVLCLLSAFGGSSAFNVSRPNNLVAYWGGSSDEDRLSAYCDGTVDAIIINGLSYRADSVPTMSLQGVACGDTNSPNSSLTECRDLELDVLECQNKGVAILLALFGGDASATDWAYSPESARTYADLLWNLVLGGSSSTRPFGQAPLDGVVLNIVSAQSSAGLLALVDGLRTLSEENGRQYFWTTTISCASTDILAVFDVVISSLSMIFVDVSISYCSVAHYENKTRWNYGVWDDLVSRQSLRSDFRLYLNVDASDTVSSTDDYANSSRLAQIASDTMTQYPRYFGGISYWDAAYAASNDGFNVQLRQALSTLALPSTSSSSSTSISPTPVTTQNPLPSDGSESHSSHTKLIVGTTIPVLSIVCLSITTLVYLRQRQRRARRGDEDLGESTAERIEPYPTQRHDKSDSQDGRKSNLSPPGLPRDSVADPVQPVNAVYAQPTMLQNPEGLAALETAIGRVGLTVPALLASLERLGTPPSAMSVDSVSETVTNPPEYS